jgi:hypothetical protein
MIRLAVVLYSVIATALAGSFVVAVLSAGMDTLVPILIAAGAGALLAVPVSLAVARAIIGRT